MKSAWLAFADEKEESEGAFGKSIRDDVSFRFRRREKGLWEYEKDRHAEASAEH
jgi:hypothetical protein